MTSGNILHHLIGKATGLLLLIALPCLDTNAQTASPTISFTSSEDDTQVEMSEGDAETEQAPLELTCSANVSSDDDLTYTCEWRFYDNNSGTSDTPILTRFEENTTYTLETSGSYSVKLFITFRDSEGNEAEYESDAFNITISESQLTCPDGFSPNDDGINDVFHITCKSIVKLEAMFFNRWGKKLYTMDLSNYEQGWDGKVGGKAVKDGVYFLNLNAVGSDGVEYKIKKAINVLKGFRESSDSGGTTTN